MTTLIDGLKKKRVQKALGTTIWGAVLVTGIQQGNWFLIIAALVAFVKIVGE